MARARRWGRVLLALTVALAGLAVLGWGVAQRQPWPAGAQLPAIEPGADLDAWLAAREAAAGEIAAGAEKRIVWAGAEGARTPVALVHLHGLSATRQDLAPVPERIARAIGANLFETRLSGHGLLGHSLSGHDPQEHGGAAPGPGDVSARDFAMDLAEAMAIARRLGERTVLIGAELGGALAVLAATDPAYRDPIHAVILISPAFGPEGSRPWLLDLPLARRWLPRLAGTSEEAPPPALIAAREVQHAAASASVSAASAPALVFLLPHDRVSEPARARQVMARWGSSVATHDLSWPTGPEPTATPRTLLPARSREQVVTTAVDWLRGIGVARLR